MCELGGRELLFPASGRRVKRESLCKSPIQRVKWVSAGVVFSVCRTITSKLDLARLAEGPSAVAVLDKSMEA